MCALSNIGCSSLWRRLSVVVTAISVMWTVSLLGGMVQADGSQHGYIVAPEP